MHMPTGWLIKHQRMASCFKNMGIRLRGKDVEVVSWCAEMESNLAGKKGEEMIEGVALLTYLGRPMYQSDNYWPEVRRNNRKS